MRCVLSLTAITLIAGVGVADAQSLQIRQTQQQVEADLAEDSVDIPQNCGAEIPVSVDWTTFAEQDYDGTQSIFFYCREPIQALRSTCQDELGRQAVQEQIQSMVCARGDTRSAVIEEDGTYRYTFTWEDSGSFDWHRDFLLNNL